MCEPVFVNRLQINRNSFFAMQPSRWLSCAVCTFLFSLPVGVQGSKSDILIAFEFHTRFHILQVFLLHRSTPSSSGDSYTPLLVHGSVRDLNQLSLCHRQLLCVQVLWQRAIDIECKHKISAIYTSFNCRVHI